MIPFYANFLWEFIFFESYLNDQYSDFFFTFFTWWFIDISYLVVDVIDLL